MNFTTPYNFVLSADQLEHVQQLPDMAVPRQAMSVREILDKFRATGQIPVPQNMEYGEDPTARPDYDLLDAKQELDAISKKLQKANADRAAAEAQRRQQAIDEQVALRVKEELAKRSAASTE